MEPLIVATTVTDLAALAGLAWVVWRAGRDRDAALGEQRAALETLRADLAALVADAERRARALEESLAAREGRLRALLVELARAEGAPRAAADPAEARLLRDIEMSFGRGA
jgi:hypothetical protein